MTDKKKTTKDAEKKVSPKPAVKAASGKKTEPKVAKKTAKISDDKKMIDEVKASARFVRITPRKVRLVIDQLRGLDADKAIDNLQFVHKAATRPVAKLLNSAIANAENNFQIDKKDLFVKKIVADDGPTLKRYQPRAFGRSTVIRKRTSHINLILGVKEGAKLKTAPKKVENKEEIKVLNPSEVKKEASKNIDKSSGSGEGSGEGSKGKKGFGKGIFQRKTG